MVEMDELYEISSTSEIMGNDAAITAIRTYANNFSSANPPKPLMLYGPPGTGKTAAAHVIAAEFGWNVVETGANDYRDADSLAPIMAAALSRNVFGSKNVIIFDEIDELASRFDAGAATAISSIIAKSRSPILFIANNMWDRSITFLRTKTEPVRFTKPKPQDIAMVLTRLAKRHGIALSGSAIKGIIASANGDVRSAINDMYVLAGTDDTEALNIIGVRNRKSDIFGFLDKVFLSNSFSTPLFALNNVDQDDVTRDMIINWIEENIQLRYAGADVPSAFEALASATLFNTRASRKQILRLLALYECIDVKRHCPLEERLSAQGALRISQNNKGAQRIKIRPRNICLAGKEAAEAPSLKPIGHKSA